MKDFCLPNYKDGSIVNLMSSIAGAFGTKMKYKQLKIFSSSELKNSKNVVLLIIDGLGYNYLMKEGRQSVFYSHLYGSMTSTFLPTTAAAITSFLTGVAPQQHGHTAWFMNLKEIGAVTKVLPFNPRIGGPVLSEQGIKISDIIDEKPFVSKLKCKTITIHPKRLVDTDFTSLMSKTATKLSYKDDEIDSLFSQIKKAIKSSNRRKYIYSYWPVLDSLNHKYGVNSKKAEKHFKELDKKIRKFIKSLEGTNTTLIITADHGFVNTSENKFIKAENHPDFLDCLTIPLCGEGRTPFCYVHPSKTKKFENYVKTKMKKYCHIFKSEDLIKKNYFGLFKPNPKLFDRLGDYILICKENYIIKDLIEKGKEHKNVGHHGGISPDEMIVPLIVIRG